MENIQVTLEQVGLINQLRLTGLTKDQIWLIIHDLEKKESVVGLSRSVYKLKCQEEGNIFNQSGSAFIEENQAKNQDNPMISKGRSNSILKDLEDFKQKGELDQISEIRYFIKANKIRQNKIAAMIDTSPSFISRFLNGDPKAQSTNLRNKLNYWYILVRDDPAMTRSFYPIKLDFQKDRNIIPDPEILPVKRFQFTKFQMEVLENFYKLTINPDKYTMNDILVRLNSNSMGIKKVGKVTNSDVENWFERKRMAKTTISMGERTINEEPN